MRENGGLHRVEAVAELLGHPFALRGDGDDGVARRCRQTVVQNFGVVRQGRDGCRNRMIKILVQSLPCRRQRGNARAEHVVDAVRLFRNDFRDIIGALLHAFLESAEARGQL